jgi:hypothetical protein
LAYLDSKYEDYSFDGIIASLFGTTVKSEIESIHALLHQLNIVYWTEYGSEPGDETHHRDAYLITQSWETYYATNKDALLTADQQEQYNTLLEVGVYAFKKELSSPFLGTNWSLSLSSRWGWRIHPITGVKTNHLGLDIAMPGGTPINACMAGVAGVAADGSRGNYVTITDEHGTYTLYAHMSATAATDGQPVDIGQVIGYVGSTGDSTGDHLHLEYHKNGHNLNPLIFVECDT